MNSSITSGTVTLRALRWAARILSILSVGIVLLFAFGEGLHSPSAPWAPRDLALGVFFPFGVCLGMIAAWRWEALGGGITIGSLAAFYLVHRLLSSCFPRGFALAAFAAPGFLFLICWLWTRSSTKHQEI